MIKYGLPGKYYSMSITSQDTAPNRLFYTRVFPMLFILILTAGIGNVFSQQEKTGLENSVLADIRQKLAGGAVFKAEFNHWSADTFTGDTTRYNGEIWITRNHYRVEAKRRLLVVSDSISRVHDRNRNRVIISTYDPNEDEFAPARLLYRTPEQYQISQNRNQGSIIIDLKANDPFAYFKTITLEVASQSRLPQHVKAVDQTDNVLMTSFSSGEYLANTPEGLFDMDYPEDAEVIDLRKE